MTSVAFSPRTQGRWQSGPWGRARLAALLIVEGGREEGWSASGTGGRIRGRLARRTPDERCEHVPARTARAGPQGNLPRGREGPGPPDDRAGVEEGGRGAIRNHREGRGGNRARGPRRRLAPALTGPRF